MASLSEWPCLGVDFTSAPSRRKPVALAEFVEGDNAGVVQLRQRLGLAGEAVGKLLRLTDGGRQDFQGDDAVEILLPDLVNRAHAAFSDEFEDFKLRENGREFLDG